MPNNKTWLSTYYLLIYDKMLNNKSFYRFIIDRLHLSISIIIFLVDFIDEP